MLRLEFRQAQIREAKMTTFSVLPFVPLNSRCHFTRLYLCTVLLRWGQRELSFYLFIYLDHSLGLVLERFASLQSFPKGRRSASSMGRSQDVRFQNQAFLAATTAWWFELGPNLFSAGMSTESLILTGLSYFGSLTNITDTGPLSRIRPFVSSFPSLQQLTKDVLNQNGKKQDQCNVTLILRMIRMNNEKQPMCFQKAETCAIH